MAISRIEWTEATWNPITGCTKISDGCTHCYAETFARRLHAMGNPRYSNGFNVTIHYDLFALPLSWRKPRMIFVNSMSDIFHDAIPDEVVLALFNTMNQATWHTFQVLTKRADRLLRLSSRINWTDNIWMGVSIENQRNLHRVDELKQCGACVKFVSAEPLLESISQIDLTGIHWLIVGGESGANCRPINEIWIRELLDKARKSGTAFFFKQWGGFHHSKGGSLLDGQNYKEYPRV